MQCPICGVIATADHFKYIGAGKRICSSCQSILHIGYRCPTCGSFNQNSPYLSTNEKHTSPFPISWQRILNVVKDPELICKSCGYRSSYRHFQRILFQKERYSLME